MLLLFDFAIHNDREKSEGGLETRFFVRKEQDTGAIQQQQQQQRAKQVFN